MLDEPRERAGAGADTVLFLGVDFAEGQGCALRDEHRIVAETSIASRRPNEIAFDFSAKQFGAAARPGEGEDRNKFGAAVLVVEFAVNPLHPDPKVFGGAGPAGGADSRSAAERRDNEAGMNGEGRQPDVLPPSCGL